ncbi:MAG: hypothetical protein IT427_06285 [Pirellulales bacterium]|nr:hypothetical protein [Pirellulales bacterium]
MFRYARDCRLFQLFLVVLFGAATSPSLTATGAERPMADLPTAEQILTIYRRNKEQLSNLHLQLVQPYEMTDVESRRMNKQAQEHEVLLKYLTDTKPEEVSIEVNGKSMRGAEAVALLKASLGQRSGRHLEVLREAKPFQTHHTMEIFIDGENYQYRESIDDFDTTAAAEKWKFPDRPISADALTTTYADIGIYSRCESASPAGKWWHRSTGQFAYIMQKKHLCQLMNLHLPPLTDMTRPDWGEHHPYDAFFSQSADKYRVLRQEVIDGRTLTVVEVIAPLRVPMHYRGWLDLDRGAWPLKMYQRQVTDEATTKEPPTEVFDRWPPGNVTTTQEIYTLPGGGHYPTKMVMESMTNDPDVQLTNEQWAEVRAGTRESPKQVVARRCSWDCLLIETHFKLAANFFDLPFPDGQKIYDHDAGKVIGALERQPLVQVGQSAPPLSIARWLDGKQRKLDDFRGQVLVLDFCGFGCNGSLESDPRQPLLEQRFEGKPVAFVSLYSAAYDTDKLAKQIEEHRASVKVGGLAAIDKGSMVENSATLHAYGIPHSGFMVVVNKQGKIVYVDPFIDGPSCDEEDQSLIAAFEEKFNALWKQRFDAVGEIWPLPKEMSDSDQMNVFQKVHEQITAKAIETALNAASAKE